MSAGVYGPGPGMAKLGLVSKQRDLALTDSKGRPSIEGSATGGEARPTAKTL